MKSVPFYVRSSSVERRINQKYDKALQNLREFWESRVSTALGHWEEKTRNPSDAELCNEIKEGLVTLFTEGIKMADDVSNECGEDSIIFLIAYRSLLGQAQRLPDQVIPLERKLRHSAFRMRLPGEDGSPEKENCYDWPKACELLLGR